MISKFLLIEFLITTQITNISFLCSFDKDDKQFHILWKAFDKCKSRHLSTHCLILGPGMPDDHSFRSSWDLEHLGFSKFPDITIYMLYLRLLLEIEISSAGLESCLSKNYGLGCYRANWCIGIISH